MGEGQDLQGPLGDGGQMGGTLFVCIEVVDVVPKKASVALQNRISREFMLISGLYVESMSHRLSEGLPCRFALLPLLRYHLPAPPAAGHMIWPCGSLVQCRAGCGGRPAMTVTIEAKVPGQLFYVQ